MKTDSDIELRLGKFPRKLATLYLEIYDECFVNTYRIGQTLIKNAFKWLLCIQETLKSGEFLAAIAQNLSPAPSTLSKDEIIDLCCNFISLDETLDTFRFAHPSVQEFLRDLPEYTLSSCHGIAAECCLVYLTSRSQSPSIKSFLAHHYLFGDRSERSIRSSVYSHAFGIYATRLLKISFLSFLESKKFF